LNSRKSQKLSKITNPLNSVEFDFQERFDFSSLPDHGIKMKYILIQTENSLLVRGWSKAEFHDDIAVEFRKRTQIQNITVLGGGRIELKPTSILVYGHSIGYPWPEGVSKNSEVADLIKKCFPSMSVSFSNSGY
jgi:Janus/Ocnus family (Ocnus)